MKDLESIITLQIQETESAVEGLKISSKPVELDQQGQGRVSRIDAIQHQQMHLAGLKRLEQKLSMLKSTQKGIKEESVDFGLCIDCEEEISFERLKVRPESRMCVNCSGKK